MLRNISLRKSGVPSEGTEPNPTKFGLLKVLPLVKKCADLLEIEKTDIEP